MILLIHGETETPSLSPPPPGVQIFRITNISISRKTGNLVQIIILNGQEYH